MDKKPTPFSKALKAMAMDPSLVERVLMLADGPPATSIECPEDAIAFLRSMVAGRPTEFFAVIGLDSHSRVVDHDILTRGNEAHTIVDPKQILRWALTRERSVAGIMVAHNHPSGDCLPSGADLDVTKRLKVACDIVGIELIDHITVGRLSFTSIRGTTAILDGHANLKDYT